MSPRKLEQAADRARNRGGWAATGAFLTRSAALTPATPTRLWRMLAAAQAETMAGAPLHAQGLLDSVAGQLDDDPLQRVQGAIHSALDETAQTAFALLDAARHLAPLDAGQARSALVDALAAARISGLARRQRRR